MNNKDGHNHRVRRNFGKIEKIIDIPNLIEIQRQSYDRFLQKDIAPEDREDIGLQGAFKSVFPIRDFSGTSSLEFIKYTFEEFKYDENECMNKGMTYEAPLKLTVRLLVFDTDATNGTKSIRDIKEQDIYFGTLPMMTNNGTFIVNGTERVVVSQLHRSPGVFFDHDKGKTHSTGKLLYSARIIPLRGSWLDFEFDPKDLLYVRIDRRRKFPATTFLKALGYTTKDVLSEFYETETITLGEKECLRVAKIENLYRQKITREIVDPKTKDILAKEGDKYTSSRPHIEYCRPRLNVQASSHLLEFVGILFRNGLVPDTSSLIKILLNHYSLSKTGFLCQPFTFLLGEKIAAIMKITDEVTTMVAPLGILNR